MSLFQSGPYQSRILSQVTRRTRQWLDQGAIALRHLKVTAAWTVQAVLYPVYVVFQSSRLLGAQIRQAIELNLPRLRAAIGENPINQPGVASPTRIPELAPRPLTAEAPLHNVLQLVQHLTHPTPVAELAAREAAELAGPVANTLSLPASQPLPELWGSLTARMRAWISRWFPQPDAIATPGQLALQQTGPLLLVGQELWALTVRSARVVSILAREVLRPQPSLPAMAGLPAMEATQPIRGVVTLLQTRSLALVTHHNEILDILTPAQQEMVRRRIIWEVANYGRVQRVQLATRQAFARLRPSLENPHVLLPVRLFYRLMAWMQGSPLAIAANLFREAELLPLPAATAAGIRPTADQPLPPSLPPTGAAIAADWLQQLPDLVHRLGDTLSTTILGFLAATQVQDAGEAELESDLTATAGPIAATPFVTLDSTVTASSMSDPAIVSGTLTLPLLAPVAPLPVAPAAPQMVLSSIPAAAIAPIAADLPAATLPPPPVGKPPELPFPGAELAAAWLEQLKQQVRSATATLRPETSITQQAAAALRESEAGLAQTQRTASVESQPDYIEADATLLGYVQPPLEKLLRWLDLTLLWLEERLIWLWQRVQQWIQSRFC